MPQASVKSVLEALAVDSQKRFQALLDAGAEIPYEVNESDGTQLPQYTPMTEHFVREHLETVRRSAIGADQAGRYLEELSLPVPPEATERAEQALTEFVARVWRENSSFELDRERVGVAIGELEGAAKPARGDSMLVTPLIGLQLPLERLELAGASVVRADLADVPAEARRVERSGTAPWEPVYLAILSAPRKQGAKEKREPVGAMLRRLLMTLRMFKSGGVATGPYAWVSAGGEKWRQVTTGAPRPRAGGYRLAESELGSLAELARAIRDNPRRLERLRRALARFEAGLERGAALDSLNDHLLALRYMLEGDGPARTGLAMRAAALSAPEERDGVKAMVERAQALERELWSGEPAAVGQAPQTPAHLAGDIEELVRRILRDAARGRTGSDLRAAADEALLGDGLAIGHGHEADLGGSAEWGLAGHDAGAEPAETAADGQPNQGAEVKPAAPAPTAAVIEQPSGPVAKPAQSSVFPPTVMAEHKPIPEAEPASAEPPPSARPGLTAVPSRPPLEIARPSAGPEQLTVDTAVGGEDLEPEIAWPRSPALKVERNLTTPEPEALKSKPEVSKPERAAAESRAAWLDEVDAEPETIEWPVRPEALKAIDRSRQRPTGAQRVTHLFPRAEVEWSVGELQYERSKRPHTR